ncbi:P12 family lipoprotein [Borrelia venezuelensis]|uniref:P12 family lipoprotein n=1 Tax=Borrelia venezuelensis TaxID=1653839 RepID=UPI001FF1906D|nr:P12 family lipoprotein [Borrelia venezuelensis]UPA12770.1 P12 family lipoprotein [Borrelia venezuelensis]UPA12797.1 P12 family lipoprotein [Borrelia venezuelensis]UPA12850.1 P12 family lipoprotein [Borrelia venezuelensis]
MKRSILSVCMLTLLCLLSCDINALNELLDKAREKFLDESKDNKDLNHKQENQEQKEVVIDDFEEEVEIQQDMEVKPVNAGFVVPQQVYPYYLQQEIVIDEKDLVPSTDEEKKAQEEIEKVKSALGDSGFQQLIEDALKLKSEYKQLEFSFYDTLSELKNKRENYSLKSRRENRAKKSSLTQLQNKLNDQRSQIDMLRIKVDNGLDERRSAEFFFNKSQETLREAITERLRENKRRSYRWSRRGNSDFLARDSRRYAENVSSLLESSSSDIGEVIGRKKEIEGLIKDAKSVLENLAR